MAYNKSMDEDYHELNDDIDGKATIIHPAASGGGGKTVGGGASGANAG